MIELKKIFKKYKNSNTILDDISIKFNNTGLYFITGKSGSGKSTLLSILSGIDLSFDGQMLVDNLDIKDMSSSDINYYRASYVGYVFQDYNLIRDLSVYDNIKIACEISGTNEEEIDEVLKKLDIIDLKNKSARELSGGEAQRVAIARCLVKHPKVILADEPTGALDKDNGENIMNVLATLSSEYTVIIVTHDSTFIDKYDSTIIPIKNGKIIMSNVNDIDNAEFEPKKVNNLSSSFVLSFARKTLLKKKNGLFLSLVFIIISVIMMSLSISGFNYDYKYSAYNQMIKTDSYISVRFGRRDSEVSTSSCTTDYLDDVETSVDEQFVYGYKYSSITLTDAESLIDYYWKAPTYDYEYQSGVAYEYNIKSRDLFGLSLVAGNEPSNINDCVMSDILADIFIEMNYNYDSIKREITTYNDLLGLNLFGYNITGIVSSNKSNYYRKKIQRNKKKNSGSANGSFEDISHAGCANSIFINSNLLKTDKLLISYSYLDEKQSEALEYNSNYIKSKENINSNTITYLNGNNLFSNGAIVGASIISKKVLGKTFEEQYNYYYQSNKYWNLDWSDDECKSNALESATNDVLNNISDYNIKLNFESSFDNEYSDYITLPIIGIDFENSLSDIYVDSESINTYEQIVSKITNIEVLLHSSDNNKRCRQYAYNLMDASLDYSCDENAYMSNYMIVDYLDMIDVFNALEYAFLIGAIVFLLIGLFIIHKYIIDSIMRNEKDFGVLKSIGVKTIDIFRIFNIQNIIISVIIMIFGFTLQYVGVHLVNRIMSMINYDSFTSYYISAINYIIIILLSVLAPLVISLYPTIKCSVRSPKDILNNN